MAKRHRYNQRRKNPKLEDKPVFVVLMTLAGALTTGYFSIPLGLVTPDYFRVANSVPINEWGIQGWAVTGMILVMAVLVILGGMVFAKGQQIIIEKYMK